MTDVTPTKGMVHEQVAHTSKALAEAFWEDSATRSNQFYALCPDKQQFIDANWHEFVPIARSILTDMLTLPEWKVSEAEKIGIFEALKKEHAVNPKKLANPQSTLITPGSLLLPDAQRAYLSAVALDPKRKH